MKYQPGLSNDTKPLPCSTRNRAKCPSKVILASNVTPNITKSEDSVSTVHLESMGLTEDELYVIWRLS